MSLFQKPATSTFSTRRVEALTDGVFAIAMTLMVLDLKIGDLTGVTDSITLWNALVGQAEGILVFVISFLLLGSMWAIHTRQFEYITRTDRHLTMINTLRLLVVVLMPLTTGIAGAYHDIPLANVMLPINFLLLVLVSAWQWRYAIDPAKKLASKELTREIVDSANIRNRSVLIIAICVVLLSLVVGELAFLLFVLLPFVTRLVGSIGILK